MKKTVVSVGLAVDESLRVVKNVIMPDNVTGKEKRICIVTGTHGDELEGHYVCYELNRIIRETDYVAVASSSAVKALHGMLDNKEDIQAKLISIGPSTTKTADELGFRVWRTAAEYTAEGMVAAILGDVVPG